MREAAAGAVLEVELELPGVEGVAGDLAPREVVLAQADRRCAIDDRERVRVLGAARRGELVDDLERLGDLQAGRHVEERAAAPEGCARGLELVAVERQPAQVVALKQLAVLDRGRKIAEGTPAEVQNSQAVMRAYLGGAAEEQAA